MGYGVRYVEALAFLSGAVPLYLAGAFAAFLVFGIVSGRGVREGALWPFAGFVVGMFLAGLLSFLFPFNLLMALMTDFTGPPLTELLFRISALVIAHAVAFGTGFLAARVAGSMERVVAAISVWVGASLGFGASIAYSADVPVFDPLIFVMYVTYALAAMWGGVWVSRM